MDAVTLASLAQLFFSEPFPQDQATGLLGPIASQERGNLHLTPKPQWECRQITLETKELKSGKTAIVGISLTFTKPIRLSLRELTDEWGNATPKPRLKPTQPTPFQFLFKTPNWQGYALVDINQADPGAGAVPRIFLRRQELE